MRIKKNYDLMLKQKHIMHFLNKVFCDFLNHVTNPQISRINFCPEQNDCISHQNTR